MLLATTMFVACSEDKSAAEKQMLDYKAEWVEITSVVDAQAVEDMGFEAWYNTLSNSDVRAVYEAVDRFDASYTEVDHWYKNLSDGEQSAARAAGEKWERENTAEQRQIELFAENLLDVDFAAEANIAKALLKMYRTEVAEVVVVEEECPENNDCPTDDDCADCADCVNGGATQEK